MMLTLVTRFDRVISDEQDWSNLISSRRCLETEWRSHTVHSHWISRSSCVVDSTMQFGEMSFYSDVQLQIRNPCLSHEDSSQTSEPVSTTAHIDSLSSTDIVSRPLSAARKTDSDLSSSSESNSHSNGSTITHEKIAPEIAVVQLRLSLFYWWPSALRDAFVFGENTGRTTFNRKAQKTNSLYHCNSLYLQSHPEGDVDSLTIDFFHSSNDPFTGREGADESGVQTTQRNSLHTKLYRKIDSIRFVLFWVCWYLETVENSNRKLRKGLLRSTTCHCNAQTTITSFYGNSWAMRT